MSPARRKLRQGGRLRLGIGGRLHVGMGGRLRRNPHPEFRKARPVRRTAPPRDGRFTPKRGKAPGPGGTVHRSGRIVRVCIDVAPIALWRLYTLDMVAPKPQANAYYGGPVITNEPCTTSGFCANIPEGPALRGERSLTTEKGGRPPCPRTPLARPKKGTWSPGKPCAPLPTERAGRLRGEAGTRAHALYFSPPNSRSTTSPSMERGAESRSRPAVFLDLAILRSAHV